MQWPGTPNPASRLSAWCKRLLEACKASELKPGNGYSVRRTSGGTVIELHTETARAVYVRCCLEDNTQCWVPVLVRGDIVRDLPEDAIVLEVQERAAPAKCAALTVSS